MSDNFVDNFCGIRLGDYVTVKTGIHKYKSLKICAIQINSGAVNGWFTCKDQVGNTLLFTGEEIAKMTRPLMKCGHAANSTDKDDKPACVICAGLTPDAHIEVPNPDISWRSANCFHCETVKPSNIDLPFFEYRPTKEQDKFYCGCLGWD